MIKLIKNNQKKEKYWRLEVNEEIIQEIKFSDFLETLHLYVSLEKTSPNFFNQNVSDFFSIKNESVSKIIEINIDLGDLLEKEELDLFINKLFKEEDEENNFAKISLEFVLNSNNAIIIIKSFAFFLNPTWTNSFSLLDYSKFVQSEIAPGFESKDIKEGIPVIGFQFPLPNTTLTLINAIHSVIEKFRLAHQKAFNELSKKTENNSLTAKLLNFPEEVRVPCEQYLLYFSEFLKDLGVSANADITHKAGETLFSVTPNNPNQALDKIRVALEIFLNLPKSEIIIVPDEEFEIAMLKAKANIDHLNSQLFLAKAVIRVKEREIQAFEVTLETKDISIEFLRERLNQQKRLLNGEIAEGIIDIEPKPKEDKEEFFDGVFALTQYEEKGVRVNLAQLYRKLKTYLKGE